MSNTKEDDTLRKDTVSGIVLQSEVRKESTRTIMVKEIDSMKRHIQTLHLIAPWNETLMGAAIGLFVSGIFGVLGLSQTRAPIWVIVGTWVLFFIGLVSAILCFCFRKSMDTIEKEQKDDLLIELEHWKTNDQ